MFTAEAMNDVQTVGDSGNDELFGDGALATQELFETITIV